MTNLIYQAEERLKKEKALRDEEDDEEEEIVRTKPKKSAPQLREDLVNSSVNFLNHPKVKPSPLSQKMAFLQKKGLTQEEIQEALNRANAASPSAAVQGYNSQGGVLSFWVMVQVVFSRFLMLLLLWCISSLCLLHRLLLGMVALLGSWRPLSLVLGLEWGLRCWPR